MAKPKQARARHILVDSEFICQEILEQLEKGMSFAHLADIYSECPSGTEDGGDLGWFRPKMMVKEFDKVIFSGKKGQICGPVKTEFGYHVIEILDFK